MSDPEKDLFDEAEIVEEPSLDEKLDTIIDLLKKNEKEHQEIREELKELRDDMNLLRAAYQQHGKALGEISAQMNGHFGGRL